MIDKLCQKIVPLVITWQHLVMLLHVTCYDYHLCANREYQRHTGWKELKTLENKNFFNMVNSSNSSWKNKIKLYLNACMNEYTNANLSSFIRATIVAAKKVRSHYSWNCQLFYMLLKFGFVMLWKMKLIWFFTVEPKRIHIGDETCVMVELEHQPTSHKRVIEINKLVRVLVWVDDSTIFYELFNINWTNPCFVVVIENICLVFTVECRVLFK